MPDFNELAQQLRASMSKDPQTRAALEQLMQQARSIDGQRIAQNISASCASQIEQAAAAAQRGDLNSAKDAITQMMNSPEGADLARQLQFLMGK
ncbi:MAG: hypothetical protein AB7C89_06910 [Intestinibacillus sp.]